jgi:translocator protein
MHKWISYVIAFVSVFLTSLFGGLFTRQGTMSPWYDCIRPDLTPPKVVFPIVWTLLYLMLGMSFALTLSSNASSIPIVLQVLNLMLNVFWCYSFFAMKSLLLALCVLLLMIVCTALLLIYLWPLNRAAALLLLPYLSWILFAMVLNIQSLQKSKMVDCDKGRYMSSI